MRLPQEARDALMARRLVLLGKLEEIDLILADDTVRHVEVPFVVTARSPRQIKKDKQSA